ncbi:MAG TPA: flagellar hook-basal body complex protein FliE [Woeseiaceae bacterium]|nr:flagellar hook-basal body complex protein FliE [Woeseiaceae bacterium]
MNEISPQQLLQQIRSLNAEMQATATSRPVESGGDSFGSLLKQSIEAVNETQQNSSAMKAGFENGTGTASLAQVMIASQKADLSFRAMTEVRNKLVTAYQEIMNMPV